MIETIFYYVLVISTSIGNARVPFKIIPTEQPSSSIVWFFDGFVVKNDEYKSVFYFLISNLPRLYFNHSILFHFKQTKLMTGTKSVLHASYDSSVCPGISFQIQHRVY